VQKNNQCSESITIIQTSGNCTVPNLVSMGGYLRQKIKLNVDAIVFLKNTIPILPVK